MQGQVHIDLQQFITDNDSTYIELHRGIGKTDQFIYRDAWEIGHNPNILLKIVKATDDEAVDYVSAVQAVLESPAYKLVFPNVEPDPREWGKTSLRVKRTLLSKDPTIKACGVFGNPGGRFDILRFDDICTLKNSVHSATVRERVKEEVNNTWMPMKKKGGKVHRIGTPWHINDITADWRRNPQVKVMRRPVVDGKSPWPEYWTPEMLQAQHDIMGDIAYSRAYLLQPITGDELVFAPDLILKYGERMAQQPKQGGHIIAAIDLAFRKQNQSIGTRKTNPDYSVITVARVTPHGEVYPLRMYRQRTTFPEIKKVLKGLVEEFHIEYVISEEVGAMIGLNDELIQELRIPIKPVKRQLDKHSRAIEVQSFFQRGGFHIPLLPTTEREVTAEFKPMFDEMSDFPFGEHDDTVDTAIDLMNEAKGLHETIVVHAANYDPYMFSDILRAHEDHQKRKAEASGFDVLTTIESGFEELGYYTGRE